MSPLRSMLSAHQTGSATCFQLVNGIRTVFYQLAGLTCCKRGLPNPAPAWEEPSLHHTSHGSSEWPSYLSVSTEIKAESPHTLLKHVDWGYEQLCGGRYTWRFTMYSLGLLLAGLFMHHKQEYFFSTWRTHTHHTSSNHSIKSNTDYKTHAFWQMLRLHVNICYCLQWI